MTRLSKFASSFFMFGCLTKAAAACMLRSGCVLLCDSNELIHGCVAIRQHLVLHDAFDQMETNVLRLLHTAAAQEIGKLRRARRDKSSCNGGGEGSKTTEGAGGDATGDAAAS
jgi:hypothetical protein